MVRSGFLHSRNRDDFSKKNEPAKCKWFNDRFTNSVSFDGLWQLPRERTIAHLDVDHRG
jgi:hypothetical protein